MDTIDNSYDTQTFRQAQQLIFLAIQLIFLVMQVRLEHVDKRLMFILFILQFIQKR